MKNIVGQTPWPLLNQITERNLELWKTLQEGILGPVTPARKTKASRKNSNNTETNRS